MKNESLDHLRAFAPGVGFIREIAVISLIS